MSAFSKIKKIKLFAIAITVILMVVSIMYIQNSYIYSSYTLMNDKDELAQAISDASIGLSRGGDIDAYILEIKDVEQGLVAFFQDKSADQIFGFAFFDRGLNGRYKLTELYIRPIPYSAFVTTRSLDYNYGYENLMVVGYNLGEVHRFGIQLNVMWHNPLIEVEGERLMNFMVEAVFPVESEQFFFIIPISEIYEQAGLFPEEFDYYIGLIVHEGILYDEEENDISHKYFLEDTNANWGSGASGLSPALNMYYSLLGFFVLVVGLGFIIYLLKGIRGSSDGLD